MVDEHDAYTTLGSILLSMNALKESDLVAVLEEQKNVKEAKLGKLLLEKGYITESQLEAAIAEQNKMRGKNKFAQSMAMADLALKRHRRDSVIFRRKRVVEKSEKAAKKITGEDYPAVEDEALDK